MCSCHEQSSFKSSLGALVLGIPSEPNSKALLSRNFCSERGKRSKSWPEWRSRSTNKPGGCQGKSEVEVSSSSEGTLGRCVAEQGSVRKKGAASSPTARAPAACGGRGQRKRGSDPVWSPRARRPRKDFALSVNSARTCISPQGCRNDVPQSWGLAQHDCSLSQFWKLEVGSPGVGRARPPLTAGSWERPPGLSRLLVLQAALCVLTCGCITWPAFLCLSLSSPFSHDDTNHIGLGPTLPQWKQQWLQAGGCGVVRFRRFSKGRVYRMC